MALRPREIKAVFFDLGKVLLDFSHEELVGRLLSKSLDREGKAPALYRFLFDRDEGLCNLYDEGRISSEDFYREIDARFSLRAGLPEFAELWNGIFTENAQVSSIMRRVREKRPVFLLSNVNELHWEFAKDRFAALSEMDGWVLSCRVKAKKPSPGIYAAALGTAGIGPGESIFIDDLEENVAAARENGIEGILFDGARELERGLREIGVIN